MKNCEESYLGSGHLQVLIQSALEAFISYWRSCGDSAKVLYSDALKL